MIAAESAGRAIKVPVATVAQTGFTIPSQSAGLPPPILIQVGDMVAYWGISGTTAGTFGAVALANLSAATASTTALAYAAAINALMTTNANFMGVSEEQYRLNETMDANSILNNITVNTKDDYWMPCVALPAAREVGAYVCPDGTVTGTASPYSATLLNQQVSFTSDKPASAGNTAVTSTLATGVLIERAASGATQVKIRLKSQKPGS